jgi:hypothetical protein
VWPERRTGFDRRAAHPVLGRLRNSGLLVAAVLVSVNLLSGLDGALTLWELQGGFAAELNPVLSALYSASPWLAVVFKLGVTAVVTWALWTQRRYRPVLQGAVLVLAVYVALIGWHAAGIARALVA